MRVLCVNTNGEWFQRNPGMITRVYLWGLYTRITPMDGKTSGPKYGDECRVVFNVIVDGELFYSLAEWLEFGSYHSKWFIPLSENEEVAVKEKVNLESI